jgi:Spy/CpxP family protein refolding chaperone
MAEKSRLDTLDAAFTLTKEQKKSIKALLDDAHKSAAPAREGLTKTRAAIAAAIQGNKGQADIDAAVKAYAEQSAAMTAIEMKALADIMKAVDATQRANNAAVSSAFFLLRGAFLDSKRWDDIPDGRMY